MTAHINHRVATFPCRSAEPEYLPQCHSWRSRPAMAMLFDLHHCMTGFVALAGTAERLR
jgi:hypothetical protein